MNINGGQTSWPTTDLNPETVQSQPATQSSVRQTTHQPSSSSSTGTGFVGASEDSALLNGMQSSFSSYAQFLSRPHTSPQCHPSNSADTRVSPQSMVQPDGTPGFGLGGEQQSTWATAQARGQDIHQIPQRDDGPLVSRNGFQQNSSATHRPGLDASVNNRQISPQHPLARAHNQQPYAELRNDESPILDSAQLQSPSTRHSNNAAADTHSTYGRHGATNQTAERSLPEAYRGSTGPMIATRHQI